MTNELKQAYTLRISQANKSGRVVILYEMFADYAAEAVSALAGAGIVNGLPDGRFNPLGSLTRAEAAKVIYELVIR